MRKLILLLALLPTISLSDPLDSFNGAIDFCNFESNLGEGYCQGVIHTTHDLWVTTHMSKNFKLCKSNGKDERAKVVANYLTKIRDQYKTLLTLRTNDNDTTSAKELTLRAIASHNKAKEAGLNGVLDVGRQIISSTKDVPNWVDGDTDVQGLIMMAYIETHKCNFQ